MELRKRRAITGIVLITLICASWIFTALFNRYALGMDAFKESAGQAYKDFGNEIDLLNEQLQLLENKDSKATVDHSRDYINSYVLQALHSSRYNLEKIDKRYTLGNVEFFYIDITPRLGRIMADGQISEAEHRFIKDLSTFTKEVARIHKLHLESVDYRGEKDYFRKEKIFNKQISWVYNKFFFDTDLLYDSETYKFMRDFEGDYSDFDYESAEKACMVIYDKLIAGEPLKYNNKNEVHKQNLIFKTKPLTDDILSLGDLTQTTPTYELRLDKYNNRLMIELDTGYRNTETNDTTLMNKKAEQLAKTIYKDAKRLSADYSPGPNKSRKTVSSGYFIYLVNPKGKTDEDRNMNIQLMTDGEIVYISMPLVLND